MTAVPQVTVVMPVLNGTRTIGECLDALAAQEGLGEWELVVVDNGSTDGTAEFVRDHRLGKEGRARVVNEPARGPYAARNAGIGEATAPVIAFTDCDCVPETGWLSAGLRAIASGADLVGGQIVQRGSASPTIWERYDRATYLHQDRFIAVEHFAATANLFVRASVIAAIGRFRPELVASGDLEFGQRATRAGYRLLYAPDAKVLHHPRTTMRDTWDLHRKLGSGFAELARYYERPPVWRDMALRVPYGAVVADVAGDGGYVRRRALLPVHLLAMAGRWVGRLTRRG